MNSKTQFKVIFPNILTTSRIVLTPIIVIFGLFNNIKVAIILTAIAALTDLFDGYLARKWHVTSSVGAKLDAVSDKIFAIGIVLSLVRNVHLLILILLLEVISKLISEHF